MKLGLRGCSARLLFGYCLLNVCGAGNITCTVTQGTNQTTYSVPDKEQSGCINSWSNASDTSHSVLAHEEGWKKDGPVMNANISILITSECFPRVIYKRHCLSEDEEQTSTCHISCLKNVVPVKEDDDVGEIKTTSHFWIIIGIGSILIIVAFIYYFRYKICCYSPLNMRDEEAPAVTQ